jgi:Flp pilus assembly protein TadD
LNWDDPDYASSNSHVFTGLNWANAVWAFTTFHSSNWHPLTWLSLQFDGQLFGGGPAGFHLTNVLVHAANTVLLYLALLMMTQASGRSAVVAGLFALHPLHVESVAWIAERKDVLSTFFWMATCICYAWYVARPGWRRYVATIANYTAGLLAKPMLVTLPFVLLLLDYWPLGRFVFGSETQGKTGPPVHSRQETEPTLRRPMWLLVEKMPFFALTIVSCLVTVGAQREAIGSLEDFPLPMRAANATVTYCVYIGKMFWPIDVGLFYPHPGELYRNGIETPSWHVIGSAAFLVTVTIAVFVKGRSLPYLPVGWLWYLGTLVPVIGLVQVGDAARADRYTYVPVIGLFIITVWGGADLAGRWRIQRASGILAAVILFLVAVHTWGQLQYWGNNISVWEHTLQACGESSVAHANLAHAYLEDEDTNPQAARRDREEAARHDRDALRLDPKNSRAAHDLGVAFARAGKSDEALKQYRIAEERDPRGAQIHYSLGLLLTQMGRPGEAKAEYNTVLKFHADWPSAHFRLGELFAMEGQYTEAAAHLSEAVTMQREVWLWHAFLGFALHESGNTAKADEHYRQVDRLEPDWRPILNRDAWELATSPDSLNRNGKSALLKARVLNQASSNGEARFLDTLGAAYAEVGDFTRAVESAKAALLAASSDPRSGNIDDIKRRLQLYEQQKPFRDEATR